MLAVVVLVESWMANLRRETEVGNLATVVLLISLGSLQVLGGMTRHRGRASHGMIRGLGALGAMIPRHGGVTMRRGLARGHGTITATTCACMTCHLG